MGFSLAEMMTVAVIVALLYVIAPPTIKGVQLGLNQLHALAQQHEDQVKKEYWEAERATDDPSLYVEPVPDTWANAEVNAKRGAAGPNALSSTTYEPATIAAYNPEPAPSGPPEIGTGPYQFGQGAPAGPTYLNGWSISYGSRGGTSFAPALTY
jgi:type II secretory pathway pseudopilin PulG